MHGTANPPALRRHYPVRGRVVSGTRESRRAGSLAPMDVEPSMTSSSTRDEVAKALRQAGFDVRPGGGRKLAFPYALRVMGVPEDRESEVWSVVHRIDPDADKVFPETPLTND